MKRDHQFERLDAQPDADVVVLGGGVNGACVFDALCRAGYRTVLVDKEDFASGTSQASGMMVWGGLLYLRNLEFGHVFQLSRDRDAIIADKTEWLAPATMRYVTGTTRGRAQWWVHGGLWLYWLMGAGRRSIPRSQARFSELDMLRPGTVKGSLTYEEAFVDQSDARFVMRWIDASAGGDRIALNHCTASGAFHAADRRWHLDLTDDVSGKTHAVRAAMVVNCTGVWTDQVNADYGIDSPFKHAFSKGVYLGLPRDRRHQTALFYEFGTQGDVISHVPWGPIALWGPTETAVTDLAEGFVATREDVDFLLAQYAQRYRVPLSREQVISTRCGVRPLVVDRDFRKVDYPLDLSRRQEVVLDGDRPWISCYGGKLTGCNRMASRVMKLVAQRIAATGISRQADPHAPDRGPQIAFPGLDQPVTSVTWCAQQEQCCTLDDYLRRRTNIAQWVPRGGFGINDCNAPVLQSMAVVLAEGDVVRGNQLLEQYCRVVATRSAALELHAALPPTLQTAVQLSGS